jgi:hypothetical protein
MQRKPARLAPFLALYLGISCGDPVVAPDPFADWDSWTLVLQNERSADYGGPACVGAVNNLYCKTWRDDSYSLSGILRRKKGTDIWKLSLNSSTYVATSASSWSDSVNFFLKEDQYCAGYGLTISSPGETFAGVFGYSRDCHGSMRLGKVTGAR